MPMNLQLGLGIERTLGNVPHPGAVVAATATHWYDTRAVDNTSQLLVNLGTADNAAAVRGSTTGVDNNDPTELAWSGQDHVWLPGTDDNVVASTAVATPSGSSFAFTLDGEIEGTSASEGLISQYQSGGNHRSWSIQLNASVDRIDVFLSSDGVSSSVGNSPTLGPLGISYGPGERFTMSGSISLSGTQATVSLVINDVTVPDFTTSFAATQVFQTSIPVVVGARYNTSSGGAGARDTLLGRVYGASVGSTVFDPSDLTGWTVSRSATGLKTTVVTSSVDVFDSTDDYWQLPASATPTFTATTGEYTAVLMYRRHGVHGSWQRYFSAESGPNIGLFMYGTFNTEFMTGGVGGTIDVVNNDGLAVVSGADEVCAVVVDDGVVRSYKDDVGFTSDRSITGVGTITFAAPRVGQSTGFGWAVDAEGFSALVFDRAPSKTELDDLSVYLQSVTGVGSSPFPLFVTNDGDLTISRIDTADGSDITATWPDGTTSVITSGGSASATGQPAGAVTFDKTNVTRFELSGPWAFDLSALQQFPSLDRVVFGGGNVTTGDLSGLPSGLTWFENRGANTTSGDLSGLPFSLTYYQNQGSNTTSGNLSGLPSGLAYYRNEGSNTTTGDVSGLPSGLTYYANLGSNTTSGDLSNLPSGLTFYTNFGSNTTTGNLSGLPSGVTWYNNRGSNTTSGDLSGLPSGLTVYINSGLNTVNYALGNYGFASLNDYFFQRGVGLSQSEVDEVLADMAAAGLTAAGNKLIDLLGSNAAPSAGASADITTLQGNGWTVLTN